MADSSEKQGAQSEQNAMFIALERARKAERLWKNKYNQLVAGKQPVVSEPNQENPVISQPTISPQSAKTHTYKPWQAACTDCGEKNPDFKPETKCDNCNGTLGTVEVARKLDFCPHCGTKAKFVPLTSEAKEKVAAMVKA